MASSLGKVGGTSDRVCLLSFCYGCLCSDCASAGVYLGGGIGRV